MSGSYFDSQGVRRNKYGMPTHQFTSSSSLFNATFTTGDVMATHILFEIKKELGEVRIADISKEEFLKIAENIQKREANKKS